MKRSAVVMTTIGVVLASLDARPLVKRSRLRMGSLDARGIPSILVGVAFVVAARGLGSALEKATTALPETIREARALWVSVRGLPGGGPPPAPNGPSR